MKRKIVSLLLGVSALVTGSTAVSASADNSCFFNFDSNVSGYYLENANHLYPLTGIVTEVEETEEDNYIVTVTTGNGNQFSWLTVDCDWYVNDLASMIMDGKGTETVVDDSVILANYSGVIEHLEQRTVMETEEYMSVSELRKAVEESGNKVKESGNKVKELGNKVDEFEKTANEYIASCEELEEKYQSFSENLEAFDNALKAWNNK